MRGRGTAAVSYRACSNLLEAALHPLGAGCYFSSVLLLRVTASLTCSMLPLNMALLVLPAYSVACLMCCRRANTRRPEVHGTCDVGVGVGYDFVPFRPMSTAEGPVNLCARGNIPVEDKSYCPRGAGVISNFQTAVATSLFKMTKMYTTATGAVAGARYGVQRQPCQVCTVCD